GNSANFDRANSGTLPELHRELDVHQTVYVIDFWLRMHLCLKKAITFEKPHQYRFAPCEKSLGVWFSIRKVQHSQKLCIGELLCGSRKVDYTYVIRRLENEIQVKAGSVGNGSDTYFVETVVFQGRHGGTHTCFRERLACFERYQSAYRLDIATRI